MTATSSHNRRYLIAGAATLALAACAYGLVRFYPALGPIAGTVTPQLYVDLLPGVNIPESGRYILVDAASARLYMMEDGHVRDLMKVIVGKPDTPTPALSGVINYETLNPYWHVTSRCREDGHCAARAQGRRRLSRASGLPGHVRVRERCPNPVARRRRLEVGRCRRHRRSTFASCPDPRTRSGISSSTFRTATASTCTIRRRRSCSPRTTATSAMAASASRTRSGSRGGCSGRIRRFLRLPSSTCYFRRPFRSRSATSTSKTSCGLRRCNRTD